MKYRFISDRREAFKVGRMCKLLNVSRSGYYVWLNRPENRRSLENRALEAKIQGLHADSHWMGGTIAAIIKWPHCTDHRMAL